MFYSTIIVIDFLYLIIPFDDSYSCLCLKIKAPFLNTARCDLISFILSKLQMLTTAFRNSALLSTSRKLHSLLNCSIGSLHRIKSIKWHRKCKTVGVKTVDPFMHAGNWAVSLLRVSAYYWCIPRQTAMSVMPFKNRVRDTQMVDSMYKYLHYRSTMTHCDQPILILVYDQNTNILYVTPTLPRR